MDNFYTYNSDLQDAFQDNQSLYNKQQANLEHFKETKDDIKEPVDLLGAEMIKDAVGQTVKGVVDSGKKMVKDKVNKTIEDGKKAITDKVNKTIEEGKSAVLNKGNEVLDNITGQAKAKAQELVGDNLNLDNGLIEGLKEKGQDLISQGKEAVEGAKSKIISQGEDTLGGVNLEAEQQKVRDLLSQSKTGRGYLRAKAKGYVAKEIPEDGRPSGQLKESTEEDPLEGVEPLKLTSTKTALPPPIEEPTVINPFKLDPTPLEPDKPEEIKTELSPDEVDSYDSFSQSDKALAESKKPALPEIDTSVKTKTDPITNPKYPTQEEQQSKLKSSYSETSGGVSEDTSPTMTNEQAESLAKSLFEPSQPKFDPTAPVEGEYTGTGGAYKGVGGQTIKQGEEPKPIEPVKPVEPEPVKPVEPEPVEPEPVKPVEPEPEPVKPVEPEPVPEPVKPNKADVDTQLSKGGGIEKDLEKATTASAEEDIDPMNILLTAGLGVATLLSPLFIKKQHTSPTNAFNPSAQFGSS